MFGACLLCLPSASSVRLAAPVMQLRNAAAREAARNAGGAYGAPPARYGAPPPARYAGGVPPRSAGPYPNVPVQGNSLRTWSNGYPYPQEQEVVLDTDGRPLDATIEQWAGPGYTPRKMRVYSDDGAARPFRTYEMPRGPHSYAIRNQGPLEFPMAANVGPAGGGMPPAQFTAPPITVQGGATRSFPFDADVESVQVVLSTEGRNLQARVELLQGPDNVKQFIELEEDDGYNRPFICNFDTPGYGHTVRIINTAPMTFPLKASVAPLTFAPYDAYRGADVGGLSGGTFSQERVPFNQRGGSGYGGGYDNRRGYGRAPYDRGGSRGQYMNDRRGYEMGYGGGGYGADRRRGSYGLNGVDARRGYSGYGGGHDPRGGAWWDRA